MKFEYQLMREDFDRELDKEIAEYEHTPERNEGLDDLNPYPEVVQCSKNHGNELRWRVMVG